MPTLSLAQPDDPRLDEVIHKNLRRMRLETSWAPTVRALATGAQSPRTLRCCGSGCRPCVMDVARCTASCLQDLQSPEVDAPAETTGPFGGRGRALAGRLVARLRGRG